jgi:C-terminal processing protease CtpA/Prc
VTLTTASERERDRRLSVVIPNAGERVIRALPRIDIAPRIEIHPDWTLGGSVSQSGIRVQELTDQLRNFFGVSGNEGVLVSSVDSGAAAEKAGLKAGDVIMAVESRHIRTPSEFRREMLRVEKGSAVTLKIIRDKQERDIRIE